MTAAISRSSWRRPSTSLELRQRSRRSLGLNARQQGAWRRRLGVLPIALPARRHRRLRSMLPGFPEVAVPSRRTEFIRSHRVVSSGLPITYFSLTWQAPTFPRALKRASFRPRFGPCLPPYHSLRPFLKRPKTRHLPEPTRIPGLRRSPEKISPPTTCGPRSSTGWRIFSLIGS